MKFKRFVEGITKPLINIKLIQKDLSKYKHWIDTEVEMNDVKKMIKKIGTKYAKDVGLKFNLEIKKTKDLSGQFVIGGRMDYDEYDSKLTIEFSHTDESVYITNTLWSYIYNDFPGFIKHEVLHYQQILKREGLDKETYRELGGGEIDTKSKKYIPGNLGHKDEIEAYAMNAADEIYRVFKHKSIQTIQRDIKATVEVSDAMSDYYKLVRKDKHLWMKFINKVMKYLEDK
jgi:hypothetical protein